MPQQLKYINSDKNDQASIVNHRRKKHSSEEKQESTVNF